MIKIFIENSVLIFAYADEMYTFENYQILCQPDVPKTINYQIIDAQMIEGISYTSTMLLNNKKRYL